MSRRHRIALVWLLLGLSAAGLLGPPALDRLSGVWWDWRLRSTALPLDAEVSSAIAYPLAAGEHWLEFAVPPATPRLRVLINAQVPTPAVEPDGQRWPHALDYQLLDADRKLLWAGRYHQETSVTRFRDANGHWFTSALFLEEGQVPSDGRLILFDLTQRPGVRHLRLRLAELSAPLTGLLARAYVPAKHQDFRLDALWQRMTAQGQLLLARGSLFPTELLRPEEKRNLIFNQWDPIAPQGVRGRDYELVPLYIRREIEGDPIPSELPPGLLLDPNHDGVIPIPEQGGLLKLTLRSPGLTPPPDSTRVRLNWYGRTATQRWQGEFAWNAGGEEGLTQPFQGGLLVVSLLAESTGPAPTGPARDPSGRTTLAALGPALVARAMLRNPDGQQLDLTPPASYQRNYLANAIEPVAYEVPHAGGKSTPLRLELRPPRVEETHPGARVELLDAAGNTLAEHRLAVPISPSRLHRPAGDPDPAPLGEPVPVYFDLPAQVTGVRVWGEEPLLVAAYDQPPAMSKRERIPEDVFLDPKALDWSPGWFPLLPKDVDRLASDNRLQVIQVQRRPPDDLAAQALASGQYRWQDYLPEGAWLGQDLLTAAEQGDASRPDALASLYCPLAAQGEATLELRGLGRRDLSPTLVYLRERDTPFRLTLWLDGRIWYQGEHRGRRGAPRLGAVAPGRHQLRWEGDGQLLLNQVADCTAPALMRRRGLRLDRDLTLTIDKQTADALNLTGRLYSPQGIDQRAQLQITLSGPLPEPSLEPRLGWTFRRRDFDLRPAAGAGSAVLYDSGQTLDAGQMFAIPLDLDAPPGRYRLHIQPGTGPDAYLVLSSLEPGLFDEYRFFREELPDAGPKGR